MDKKYVIELDDQTFRLSGQALSLVDDYQSADNCTFLVSDFDQSISRVMHVEAEIKYAEALVVRKLQEEGEFDEPVSVITHWKKSRGKKNTEIFFTALPSRIYLQYLDNINEHNALLILIPIFTVLSNFINQVATKDPIAVVFRHDRFADLVIGKKNQFYFATRCVAFDTSDEQIASLWETITRELSINNEEKNIQIKRLISLNWIDSQNDLPAFDSLDIESFKFNEEPITHGSTVHNTSFTKALKMVPSMEGISPNNGKFLYYTNKLSPVFMVFLIIVTVMMVWGTFSYQSKAGDIEKNLTSVENRVYKLKKEIPAHPDETQYLNALSFIDTIFHNQYLPSYKQIINDISMGIFTSTVIEQIQIDYLEKTVAIKMNGVINAGFDSAYKEYQMLILSLDKDGYTIVDNAFNTRIDSSRFELSLSRSIK